MSETDRTVYGLDAYRYCSLALRDLLATVKIVRLIYRRILPLGSRPSYVQMNEEKTSRCIMTLLSFVIMRAFWSSLYKCEKSILNKCLPKRTILIEIQEYFSALEFAVAGHPRI